MTFAHHKALFPMNDNDVFVTVLMFLASSVGAAGGIGGGGIIVPLLVAVGGFGVHHAIPLTQVCVLGASVMNLWQNLPKRHPSADRPLIDYNTGLLLEVTTLIGTIIGVDINAVSPVWAITMALIVTLVFTTYRTMLKGFELRRKEQSEDAGGAGDEQAVSTPTKGKKIFTIAEEDDVNGDEGDEEERLLSPAHNSAASSNEFGTPPRKGGRATDVEMRGFEGSAVVDMGDLEGFEIDDDDEKRGARAPRGAEVEEGDGLTGWSVADILEEERHVPSKQVYRMCGVSVLVIVLSLLKGGEGGATGLFSCGSFGFWLIKAASFPILGYAALYIARELVRSHTSKNSVGYDYLPCDVQWTRKRAYYYPTICVSAGIAAGLLGIGGGMLKGPIMLEMGLPPRVVAATAAYMLLFTTFSTTIQFSIMGEMMYDYAVLFFFVGLASAVFGQFVLGYFVNKYRKQYLITMVIGSVIGCSSVFMGVSGLMRTIQKYQAGEDLWFTGLCKGGTHVSRLQEMAGNQYIPAVP